VVSKAVNGSAVHAWYDGRVWTAQNLGGILSGTIGVTVYKGGLYIVGANFGVVYQRWYTGAWWTDWANISTGANPVVTTLLNQGTDEYHVVSRWGDWSVLDAWYNGSRWTSQGLP
jgi:hypothetical protein